MKVIWFVHTIFILSSPTFNNHNRVSLLKRLLSVYLEEADPCPSVLEYWKHPLVTSTFVL